jgi:glutamate dehydrogenase/leucine dehydrogenase
MNSTDLLPPEILEDDPLLDAAAQLEQSARDLDLEDWIVQRLKHAQRETTVNLPLQRDSTGALTVTGLRVQHFGSRAGCLGPVLLAPDAHFAQLRALALHLTLQCALFDIPLGGSAGAIVCDPAQLSERELRQLVRDYLAALDLRGDIFVPAELPTAWTSASHQLEAAVVVGKPAMLGGIPDPAAALASGWFTLLSEVLSQLPAASYQLPNCRVALQGFSPAAGALAHRLHDAGARIVALADRSGGLIADRGLDLQAVAAHVAAQHMLYGFDGAEPVRNSEVLESDCDVLIAAAAERQVNSQNAARIRAPLVLEAVDNAVTPAAASILAARGVTVVPALLGSAPRLLSWFVEWQHGLTYSSPDQGSAESLIRRSLTDVFQRVRSTAASRKVSLPDAARLLALEKFAAILRLTQ